MSEERQVYTIDEAAELLRVHPDTVRRMIKRKQIEAHLVGGQYRIPKREVDRLLGKP